MLMNEGIQIPEGQTPMYKKQGTKAPQKDPEKMPSDNMIPDM
jgi:hypothetical protein